ncbi:uncharacterized protein LOC132726854 [Ruditapes philippinarum]|uniref:uncharacterized protein LOC132726854 n=1 Tax=Ruditapes philippinarum TaxID=129788 RepID=UPI00295B0D23|nr:uncharacterized protein LOC132726854 [Ruditapes philippinarum]
MFAAELRMLEGDPYPLKVTWKQCCLVCENISSCTSVNFNEVSKVFEINTMKMKSREYRLQPSKGWKIYEKLPCGLGYMTGKRCRHIQNQFQYDKILTYQEASDFCFLIGRKLVTVENEQYKIDLLSDAGLADMYIHANIWLGNRTETSCPCFRREFADVIIRDCDSNASIVCERH